MVLVMMIVAIGGCFVPWQGDGRDGRHDRDRGLIVVEIITEMAVVTDVARKKEPHKHGYYL